ncbi:hypothetical protein HYH03_016666 [Edaphochlamys debaryana]|uniref:Uncharacterized protein n=1 Tax=Edaphochlamys debaryana TaxID=47281 RepID=A0A836BRC9_9CHLO|nr:hypothetical protein HYH03_016666 [Edaphochlamys debaryana]|eukprot:KAG2484528.1 hypothetical protein HYH03_016666 [Edaphochlamys debaryana]
MASPPDGAKGPTTSSNGQAQKPQKSYAFPRSDHTPLAAGLRLGHTFLEGVGEGLWNVWNNAVECVWRPGEPYPHDLSGKVCIVTGGNAGIGFATARALARRGAHVVLACRDRERAREAAEAIARTPPLPGCCGTPSPSPSSPPAPPPPLSVEALPLDLGRMDSVRAFAADWRRGGRRLDLIVCNAGVMAPLQRTLTEDGLEVQFQVNFLSHWLLANQLLQIEHERTAATHRDGSKSGPGSGSGSGSSPSRPGTRVVFVSSVVHRAGPLQWGDLLSESSYEPYITYGGSKLATLIAAKELQRRFDRHPELRRSDTAVAIHPGIARTALATAFFKDYGAAWAQGQPALQPLVRMWHAFMDTAGQAFLATTDQTSARMLDACLGESSELAGGYLAMGRVYAPDQAAEDPTRAEQLWAVASRLTGYTPPPSLS